MSLAIYYTLIFVVLAGIITAGCLLRHKSEKAYSIFFKVVSVVLGVVFFFRYMLGEDAIQEILKLENTPFDTTTQAGMGLFSLWFGLAITLYMSLYGFFRSNFRANAVKILILPLAIFTTSTLYFHLIATTGGVGYSPRGFLLAIETGIALSLALLVLICETDWKNLFKRNKKERLKRTAGEKFKLFLRATGKFIKEHWFDLFFVLVVFLAVMPAYTVQGLLGKRNQTLEVSGFEIPHRIVLYIGLILPFIVHYTLRNKDYATKKFMLLYISLGTLISFSVTRRFELFTDITSWPLHLCNTAMYIMPIVLMFNMKKFFYFTYFINVAGAFLAMLMPNYDAADMYERSLVIFYINHYIAFFMPILYVSLKMFDRPKLKQFIYSMIGFAVYFFFVLVLNAVITGMNEAGLVSGTTDFFFVNSDFIADKLGLWAEKLRNKFILDLTIKGIHIRFYWLYQILFFGTYVLIGLGMWFIFEQAYQISDGLGDIRQRKEKIKLDKLALMVGLEGRSIMEPVKPELKDKLVLDNFSKRYGNSAVFAVKEANLEIHGGEIFGFLGPNGAGKSTIIKSIVGIQPITSGNIYVCGYDADKQPVEAKRELGFVPDHYALYEKLTGREYINYIADLYQVSKEDRDKRIEDMVTRFELTGAFDNQMRTYSHGMKQKIAIMSALVHDPKIWILDEPLTGLDPNSILQVKETMKEHAKRGNIVFFSSHIIDVVERICDRIAIIKKGQILTCKTVEEIEKSGKTLEKFYMDTINGEESDK